MDVRTVCIGCKDSRSWVKDLKKTSLCAEKTSSCVKEASFCGIMTSFQVLSSAVEVSFIRNRGNFHLQSLNFSSVKHLRKATGRCRHRYHE